MIQYQASEFSGMAYNPFLAKGKKMWEAYPRLKRRRELWQVPFSRFEEEDYTPGEDDLDTLLRFLAVLVVKDGNPISTETDFKERAEMAYAAIGIFKLSVVRTMFDEGHWWTSDVCAAFFMVYGDAMYETWFSMRTNIHVMNKFLRSPLSVSDDAEKSMAARVKIESSIEGQLDRLRKMEERLFRSSTLAGMVGESSMSDDRWADEMAGQWDIK